MTIWILLEADYEEAWPIGAFTDEAVARSWEERCEATAREKGKGRPHYLANGYFVESVELDADPLNAGSLIRRYDQCSPEMPAKSGDSEA